MIGGNFQLFYEHLYLNLASI